MRELRANWIGLISSILMFISLALPWASFSYYKLAGTFPYFQKDYSLHIGLSIYSYGLVGSANGVTRFEAFPNLSYIIFFVPLLVAGLIGVCGSLIFSKKGKRLLVLAGILAIISLPLFYVGLEIAVLSLPPNEFYTFGAFPSPSAFGLTGTAFENLHSDNGIGFLWLPLIAGIISIISTKIEFTSKEDKLPQQNHKDLTALCCCIVTTTRFYEHKATKQVYACSHVKEKPVS